MNENFIENPSRSLFDSFYEWLECIIESIVLVVLVFTFVFRIVNVSGRSMYKTLHDGDKVVIVKLGYKPKAGDVVVIKRGQYLDEPLIKRIIATEGQTLNIDFTTGDVIVDGKILDENYIWEPMYVQGDNNINGKVPKGHCVVMGDNRNHSTDSRFKEVGYIPNENVTGKAQFILYPFDRFGVIK